MFVWRNALVLGVAFVIVGVAYWYLQATAAGDRPDRRHLPRRARRLDGVRLQRPAARVA